MLEIEDRPHFNEKFILVCAEFECHILSGPLIHYDKGHEGCGEIVEIGDRVNDTRFKLVSAVYLSF